MAIDLNQENDNDGDLLIMEPGMQSGENPLSNHNSLETTSSIESKESGSKAKYALQALLCSNSQTKR